MAENTIDSGEFLSLGVIFDFIKKYWIKIFIRAGLSLVFCLLVFVLLYIFTPAKSFFSNPVIISLPYENASGIGKKTITYPNKRAFAGRDLISKLVLKRVYEKNELKERIGFEKFARAFYITDYGTRRAKIDAEHKAKLSVKNLRVSDIHILESKYAERLAQIRGGALHIGMTPLPGFTTTENVKILGEIPQTWFEIYSKLDAKPLPQMPSVNFVRDLNNADSGTLISLEKARICMRRISSVIRALNALVPDRQIRLDTGESLGDLQTDIDNIAAFQLSILRRYTLVTPELRSKFDRFFILGQLDAVDHSLTLLRNKQESIEKALNIVAPRKGAAKHTVDGKTAAGENSVLQLDGNFLPYFAELIRSDHTSALRINVASQMLELKNDIAYYETEKAYFTQLLKIYSETGKHPASMKEKTSLTEFKRLRDSFNRNIVNVTNKLHKFRDLLSAEYLAGRDFYIQAGAIKFHKSPLVKPIRILLAVMALWAIFNFIMVLIDFNRFMPVIKK